MIENLLKITHYLSWACVWESGDEIDGDIRHRTLSQDIERSQDGIVRFGASNGSQGLTVQCLDTETQTIHSECRKLFDEIPGDIFGIGFQSYL